MKDPKVKKRWMLDKADHFNNLPDVRKKKAFLKNIIDGRGYAKGFRIEMSIEPLLA